METKPKYLNKTLLRTSSAAPGVAGIVQDNKMLRLCLSRTTVRTPFLLRRLASGTKLKASVAKGSPAPHDIIRPEEKAEVHSNTEEGTTTWVLKTFMRHLWPDSFGLKARVALAVSFLVGSKVISDLCLLNSRF
jgi:hypothetical protein